MKRAINEDQVKNALRTAGSPIADMDTPEFTRSFEADARRLEAAVRKIGRID